MFVPLKTETNLVTQETAGRMDRVVRSLTGRSWSDVRGLIHRQCVAVNDVVVTDLDAVVMAGDRVQVRYDPGQRYHAPTEQRDSSSLRIVFEDAHLIVVDKPALLLTVPTGKGEKHTLAGVVTEHLRRKNPRAAAGVVHRLDRDTSGLLVFGVTRRATAALQTQFRERKPLREYLAVVAGRVAADSGTFQSRLGTTASLQRYSVDEEGEEGEEATTHYVVQRRVPGATVVRATLETGRRNQIRVHFAEAGHPVLGDERYRPDLARHSLWKARRLALHAARLGFDHPVTGARLEFTSPPPLEFGKFLPQE
jgi:23S rRNA pseudouridine1911/1915/1917 synthase